jgi:hypothetical protein
MLGLIPGFLLRDKTKPSIQKQPNEEDTGEASANAVGLACRDLRRHLTNIVTAQSRAPPPVTRSLRIFTWSIVSAPGIPNSTPRIAILVNEFPLNQITKTILFLNALAIRIPDNTDTVNSLRPVGFS